MKIVHCALFICFWPVAAVADSVFFKVCEDYRSGQFRNCDSLEVVEFADFGTKVLHVYADLTWTPGGNRQHPDIFFRWLHRSPDGKETVVASFPTVSAYRWRPSKTTTVTRWHIQATIWRDIPGSFLFQAYTDLSSVESSKIEEISVPVVKGEADG